MDNFSIKENISKLEEWSGLKYRQVLYDSDVDGQSSQIFQDKIINHSHLYFIVIDSNINVFGHYLNKKIEQTDSDIYDFDIFIFTLYSNGRSDVEKFKSKKMVCMHFYDNGFYYCGDITSDYSGYYSVNGIGEIDCRVTEDISKFFDVNEPEIFTGACYSFGYDNFYKPERLVVIEMKE